MEKLSFRWKIGCHEFHGVAALKALQTEGTWIHFTTLVRQGNFQQQQ